MSDCVGAQALPATGAGVVVAFCGEAAPVFGLFMLRSFFSNAPTPAWSLSHLRRSPKGRWIVLLLDRRVIRQWGTRPSSRFARAE